MERTYNITCTVNVHFKRVQHGSMEISVIYKQGRLKITRGPWATALRQAPLPQKATFSFYVAYIYIVTMFALSLSVHCVADVHLFLVQFLAVSHFPVYQFPATDLDILDIAPMMS